MVLCQVPLDTPVWCKRPRTHIPPWSGHGRHPTRTQLVEGDPPFQKAQQLANTLASEAWSRHKIKEVSQGPMVADFAFLRVVAVRDKLPGPNVWLILRRVVSTGELKAYLCNAPADTSHTTLVRIIDMRWPVETAFEDGKQLVGLGDYQVCSWTGWHHHMTLCILARFFLVRLRIRLGNKAPHLTLPQAQLLLTGILPKREFDAAWTFEVLDYRQRRNHAAYLSHRKRRLSELKQNDQ